jgi:arginyl-tRNA synthetase
MTILERIKHDCMTALHQLYAAQGAALPASIIEITPATNSKFGHYQCNSAMKLAKILSKPPIEIAKQLTAGILEQDNQTDQIYETVAIAGPGFINFTLRPGYLSKLLNAQLRDPRLGCASLAPEQPKAIIDFSSPNIAKEMHVGHLRSTIIGDCIARTLEFVGYDVLRLNHVGDWGTQFGMLIAFIKQNTLELDAVRAMSISELLKLYRAAKLEFDANPDFKARAQRAVVELQSGDSQAIQYWQAICASSRTAFEEIYRILDINIQERGESFYNPYLASVISDFEQQGLVTISDGAKCVYLDGFNNRDGEPLPLIIQKSDGGYNYATTDLAALKHRVAQEHGAWLIYVTDAGQSQHFDMVFAAARLAGYYNPDNTRIDHVPFGLVLRADGKKFQTRSGETERLVDLLQAAVAKAKEILTARNYTDVTATELQEMAQKLGINAIKYADLVNNRNSDYAFSLDRMLQFEGNTAAFVCYAFVRIQSIKRKIGLNMPELLATTHLELQTPEEIDLGLQLIRFPEMINAFMAELLPNRITEYLYTLAEKFHVFFHKCRVEGVPEQSSRVLLCEAVALVLAQGLELLGLRPLQKM